MDMTGERRIPAPRQKVWDALNDPEVLKACIPGCETLERTSDTDLKATAAVKIGPISARFNGKVKLSDLDPPTSYRINGEGQGGVAGFAKGGATVRLQDDGPGTLLKYDVKAQVGGKLAQLGARLIDATSKQMADAFFDRFSKEVASPVEARAEDMAEARATAEAGAAGPVAAMASALTESPVVTPGAVAAGQPRPSRAAPAAVSLFSLIPKEPFGYPLVFWIGSVLYLGVLVLIFSGSLFG